jgi:hypothetical protein
VSRAIAVLILSALTAACDMHLGTEVTALYAVISTEGPFAWSCEDPRGCRFRAQGMNEGPSCATQVEGMVRFVTRDGLPVLDALGSWDGATYFWRIHPHPGVPLTPGLPFEYESTEFVPQEIVARTASYQSQMTQGSVTDHC